MKQYIVEVIVEVEDLSNEQIERTLLTTEYKDLRLTTAEVTCRYYSQEVFIEEFIENITQCYTQSVHFAQMQGCVDGMWFNMFQNDGFIQVDTYDTQGDWLDDVKDDNGGGIQFYTADEDMTHDKYKQQAEFALELIGLSI